jgi:hypothetical protein
VKAVYGLKDAPRLWAEVLSSFLLSLGFTKSHSDLMLFLYRTGSSKGNTVRVGPLAGIVSGHVDDLGCGGKPGFSDWLRNEAEARFGPVRMETDTYLHVGLMYRNLPNGENTADLEEFISKIPYGKLPPDLKAPLTMDFLTELQSILGSLGYAVNARPDALGIVSVCRSLVAGEPTGEAIVLANKALDMLRSPGQGGRLWYRKLRTGVYKLVGVCDSSFKNILAKYSLGGYLIFLMEHDPENPIIGGRGHLIDFSAKQSTRVAKSTLAAELLSMTNMVENILKIGKFLEEIWYGVESASALRDRPRELIVEVATDAKDLYDVVRCLRGYHGADASLGIYVAALQEHLEMAEIRRWVRVVRRHRIHDRGCHHEVDEGHSHHVVVQDRALGAGRL